MKLAEIKGKSDKELYRMVDDLREELFRLRLRLSTGELTHTANLKKTKKDIARILTHLNSGDNDE